MYFKLAKKNVRQSIKDYMIYFLTLAIAVCIFYSFSAIADQKVIQLISTYQDIFERLMAIVSILVSAVLGGLIVYSNNTLIKKRKKEFGVYLSLGMRKRTVSRMLLLETLIVGFVSLIGGLIAGAVFSQILSLFAIRLFGLQLKEYIFTLSVPAIAKTAIYFGIIFLIVMIFNQIILSKYNLIDLLYGAKKNEELKAQNPVLAAVLLILSIGLLSAAYKMILTIGFEVYDPYFLASIITGAIGTLIFFFSMAAIFQIVFKSFRSIYLKNLNIFILRQIHNKVNTNFVSMTIICLMLFMAVTMLSTMYNLKEGRDVMLEQETPFDASASINNYGSSNPVDIRKSFSQQGIVFNENEKYHYFDVYKTELTIRDIFGKYVNRELNNLLKGSEGGYISVVSISDYNAMQEIRGGETFSLDSDEVLIISNYDGINNAVDDFRKNNSTFSLFDRKYSIKSPEAIPSDVMTTSFFQKFFYIVLPDDIDESRLIPYSSNINIQFPVDENEQSRIRFEGLFADFMSSSFDSDTYGNISGDTREQAYSEAYGQIAVYIFLGIYIGLIFLIASAAVLSLQLLSEAGDSRQRYGILKKIGAGRRLINRAILAQTLIYFLLPMLVALVHSAVGTVVVMDLFHDLVQQGLGISALIAAIILVLIYGGYYYATYNGYKRIVYSE